MCWNNCSQTIFRLQPTKDKLAKKMDNVDMTGGRSILEGFDSQSFFHCNPKPETNQVKLSTVITLIITAIPTAWLLKMDPAALQDPGQVQSG